MTWQELLQFINPDGKIIIATIINPVRKDDIYKQGEVLGFKPGIYGGGWKEKKKDGEFTEKSYESNKQHWLKKPKVFIAYNCFTFGGSQHTDWIDVDNCTFEVKDKP